MSGRAEAALDPIVRGFDRLAPVYDVLLRAVPRDGVHRAQVALLDRLPPWERALVVGAGTGRILEALLLASDSGTIDAYDPSRAMTAIGARRVASLREADVARVRFVARGIETLPPDAAYDLIVTPCVLDLFPDDALGSVADRLAAALAPGGRWLHVDFAVGEGRAAARARRVAIAGLYAFFRATCGVARRRLPDFDALFRVRGFEAEHRATTTAGLLEARVMRRVSRPRRTRATTPART